MSKRFSKQAFAVLSTTAVIASIASPVLADSDTFVDRTLSVSEDYTFNGTPKLYITEDNLDFVTNDVFELSLPSGAEWNFGDTKTYTEGTFAVEMTKRTDRVAEVKIVDNGGKHSDSGTGIASTTKDTIIIPMELKLDDFEGDLKVKLDPRGTHLTAGEYKIAQVGKGEVTIEVDDVVNVSGSSSLEGGQIRIDEDAADTLTGKKTLRLKLDRNFDWDNMDKTKVKFSGAFNGLDANDITKFDVDENELEIEIDFTNRATGLGTIYIDTEFSVNDEDEYGDVTVSVSGDDEFGDAELVIAKYADYDVEAELEDEVVEFIAGKVDEDAETGTIVIKETAPQSFIEGRTVKILLPDWVKVTPGENIDDSDSDFSVSEINKDRNVIEIDIPAGSTSASKTKEIVLKLPLVVEAGHEGDIIAEVEGAGVPTKEIVIGKAIAPIKVTAESKEIHLGMRDQAVGDVTITENVKEAFKKGKDVIVELPQGFTFSKLPKVEVTGGNLEIDAASLTSSDRAIKFRVKSESTKVSEIKISGIELTVTRMVADGGIELKISGDALLEDVTDFDNDDFTYDVEVAKVDGPGGDTKLTKAVFTLGEGTYTVGEELRTMDVAPFEENGRTYLPVRFVGEALGLTSDDIVWNSEDRSVTIFKDNRVARLVIGSNTLTLNGTPITMDVDAKVVDERTVLPIRFVAQALGSDVQFDATTRTVTIEDIQK